MEFTDLQKRIMTSSTLGQSEDVMGTSQTPVHNSQNEAEDTSTPALVGKAARTFTAASGIYNWAERAMTAPDPDFDLNTNFNTFTQGIPNEYHSSFNSVRSMEEGMLLRQEIIQDMQDRKLLGNAGFRGQAASVAGSIVDIDALLTLGSGGLYGAGKVSTTLARVGVTGKLNKIATTAVGGAEISAGLEAVNAAVRPTNDWTQVPDAAMGGLIFGGVVGTLLPTHTVNKAQDDLNLAREEFNQAKEKGFPQDASQRPVRKQEPVIEVETVKESDVPQSVKDNFVSQDSVGAASQRTTPVDPPFTNKDTGDLLKEVRDANLKDGLTGDVWDTEYYFKDNVVSKIGLRVYKAVSGTPFDDDFGRLWNSGSVIGQRLATQLFESANGVGQMKNRTAAILQHQYHTEIMAPVAEAYKSSYTKWLQEQKSTAPTPLAWNDLNARQSFDRAVMDELQWRYHDGVNAPTSSPSVRAMADAIDQASARGAEVLKGRNGELPVHGAEELQPTSGWYRQVWSGANIQRAIVRAQTEFGAKDGFKLIKNSLSSSYQQLHKWDKDLSDRVAGAVLNSSIARSDGVNTNLFRTMSPDNFEYLRQVLENDLARKGLSIESVSKQVDEIMKRIKLDNSDRGKIKPLKNRNDIDLRTPIPGTDMTLMDLIDADINKTWSGYARTAAGAASTARNGIQVHEIRSRWIPAIKDEITARGGKPLDDGFYRALESYFSGQAFSGGINPWLRRMLTTTNLSFLNSLGLTQLGELGATMGSMHLDNFIHAAPKEIKAIFNGKLSPVHEDLKYIDSSIMGDHNIYRPELMQNETRGGVQNSELLRNLDTLLSKGQRVQGFVSGFYKVNQWMQRMAGNTLIRRMADHANGKRMFGELRLKSLGFTPANESKILGYFKDGTVEFKDGTVYDLHADKWDYNAFQEFAAIINRSSGQAVQRAFRGEDAWWMHENTGAFLMYLKSFTFTALHKQLIRNARIADPEALATLLFGLGTAAAAYTAKQYTSGNQDKMNGEKLIKGTLNYSNITAPIVTFSDPVFGMLGMDSLQIGGSGNPMNGNNSLLAMPPSFNAINRISQIPQAVGKAALPGVDLDKNDIYALQAAPIVGNLYGMGYIANAMRDDIDREKRKKKKAETKAKLETQAKEVKEEPKVTKPAAPKDTNDVLKEAIKVGGGQ